MTVTLDEDEDKVVAKAGVGNLQFLNPYKSIPNPSFSQQISIPDP